MVAQGRADYLKVLSLKVVGQLMAVALFSLPATFPATQWKCG